MKIARGAFEGNRVKCSSNEIYLALDIHIDICDKRINSSASKTMMADFLDPTFDLSF